MPVWRLQCSFGADTPFARDRFVINPHFDDGGIGSDPQGLCNDLRDALALWAVGAREIHVKAYDAQGTPPVFPQGDAIVNEGLAPSSNIMREVALCLSFFSERNLPRQRGRLFIPAVLMGVGGSVRPSPTGMDKVAALVPILTDLGGNDVDWSVYSPTTNTARSVTDWWIDDEWDTIRSRGLRATTRTVGTTTEA